jgi:hypothetical protein
MRKIVGSCQRVTLHGLDYFWIDTCCIDKSGSVEPTEAINSMYRWHQNAQECYSYLSDVSAPEDPKMESSAFAKSRCLTRGWTLQELIAPSRLAFYSRDRKSVGASRLPAWTLESSRVKIHSLLVWWARMFWASRESNNQSGGYRNCLMGLFGVNVPLLCGEGERTFIRLQEEIMNISDDLLPVRLERDKIIQAKRQAFRFGGYSPSRLLTF